MKRRSFLKNAAWASVLLTGAPALSSCIRKEDSSGTQPIGTDPSASLPYRADGCFKLLQFTDTHYIAGDPLSERALRCVEEALDAEKPDLVIHTGDILFGKPDQESALEILRPIADRGIPFAVALGNHDSQFGSSRETIFSLIRDLPGCLNTAPKEGVYGSSNDVITLTAGGRTDRVLYLFDSMDAGIWLLRRTAFSEKKSREPEKRRGKRFRAATVQNITSVIDGFSFALMMTCIGIVIIIGALLWMVLETP